MQDRAAGDPRLENGSTFESIEDEILECCAIEVEDVSSLPHSKEEGLPHIYDFHVVSFIM